MKTNVLSAEEIRRVELSALPVGEFKGIWGGYQVTFDVDGTNYRLKTELGIRTPAAPCIIRIQNGEVSIETIK